VTYPKHFNGPITPEYSIARNKLQTAQATMPGLPNFKVSGPGFRADQKTALLSIETGAPEVPPVEPDGVYLSPILEYYTSSAGLFCTLQPPGQTAYARSEYSPLEGLAPFKVTAGRYETYMPICYASGNSLTGHLTVEQKTERLSDDSPNRSNAVPTESFHQLQPKQQLKLLQNWKNRADQTFANRAAIGVPLSTPGAGRRAVVSLKDVPTDKWGFFEKTPGKVGAIRRTLHNWGLNPLAVDEQGNYFDPDDAKEYLEELDKKDRAALFGN
jgi:hypothetical protein